MTIGIDASKANILQKTGTEYYTDQILKHFIELDHKNNYILYSKKHLDFNLPKNFTNKIISLPRFWHQIGLSSRTLIDSLDVLFIPAHVIPLIHPKKVVITCHDVAFEKYPDSYSTFQLWYLRKFIKDVINKATKIIAISESTKNDLIKTYKCPSDKIVVVYNGYNDKLFKPIKNPKRLIKEPYLLFVGRIEERKNIKGLIKAFSILKQRNDNLKLVLVGKPGLGYSQIQQFKTKQPADVRRSIIELGYVKEEDLVHIYAGAKLFILPSFYEGFGIPILEAMACGCPVICSNTSSLPEVGSKAVLYFNPSESEEMVLVTNKVLKNNDLRKYLIQSGYNNIKRFSWKKCAKETLKVLGNC